MSRFFTRENLPVIIAFAIVYVVWGSTYLVNYWAIVEIPPFLMSGVRFMLAGGIVYSLARFGGAALPSKKQWQNAAWVGVTLLSFGTGLVVWAEQYIDTGMAALFVAFEPLVVVLLLWQMRGKKPGILSFLGVGLGIIGMLLLVGQPQLELNTHTIYGLIAIAIGILSWGYASIYVGDADMPESRWVSSGIQMMVGGLCLFIMGVFSGDLQKFAWANLTWKGIASFIYLVVFGSLIAFSAFNYLLQKVAPDKVATTNYVNPVVAMLLGWAFNNEEITRQSILAAVILLAGVFCLSIGSVKKQ
jgi:drug/metabolite transporter (DMT)-like permease